MAQEAFKIYVRILQGGFVNVTLSQQAQDGVIEHFDLGRCKPSEVQAVTEKGMNIARVHVLAREAARGKQLSIDEFYEASEYSQKGVQ